jgi:hypothetical protein
MRKVAHVLLAFLETRQPIRRRDFLLQRWTAKMQTRDSSKRNAGFGCDVRKTLGAETVVFNSKPRNASPQSRCAHQDVPTALRLDPATGVSPYANTAIKVNGYPWHQLILIGRVNPVGRLCSRIACYKGALHAHHTRRSLSFGPEHI